jgi:16S rRNA (guanine527-N7)-methyltransferase
VIGVGHVSDTDRDAELLTVLEESRRLGFLGAAPVDEVVRHSRSFVAAIAGRAGRLVDLGSGGGVPGLVLAVDRPDLEIVLIDRRQKRTDWLERAVRRLDLVDRVVVACTDATAWPSQDAELVTARGFGPPEPTLRLAARIVRPGGAVVISEPPAGDRWAPELLAELGVRRTVIGAVARFDGFT